MSDFSQSTSADPSFFFLKSVKFLPSTQSSLREYWTLFHDIAILLILWPCSVYRVIVRYRKLQKLQKEKITRPVINPAREVLGDSLKVQRSILDQVSTHYMGLASFLICRSVSVCSTLVENQALTRTDWTFDLSPWNYIYHECNMHLVVQALYFSYLLNYQAAKYSFADVT